LEISCDLAYIRSKIRRLVRRLVGEVHYFLRLKSHANLLFCNLVYCTVVTIWGFYIITEIFYIIITITTAI
jgi:hypothetical protein